MEIRMRLAGAVLVIGWVVGSAACAPYLPSTIVPAVQSPALEVFRTALKTYIDQTQPFRKAAAVTGDAAPNQTSGDGSEAAIRLRQRTLAEAIQTTVRPAAQQGDVLSPAVADLIRRELAEAFAGAKADIIRDGLQDQNEGLDAGSIDVRVNQMVAVPRLPPVLLETLPQLPQQVEFAFSGRTLILRDVDADVVVDFIRQAFPDSPLAGHIPAPSPSAVVGGSESLFALPGIAGSTTFALIGDSGSGDAAQTAVANAMIRYFTTARRFTFVLMLGDNLYDNDYQGEFSVPYQGLLERGVLFYATLGNHDREIEQHYKPFHMTDRLYFAFTEGNARFVVLNSNHPRDVAQLAWLDGAFGNTGTKWRISFFHHPLYSSGEHAQESRDSIRPALEPALVRNRVDVVFSGHDHLYERVAPQQGIRYFVSGGGGRNLYDFHKSPFDEIGSSEHHFMVVEIAGDQLFFEAITPSGRTIDCGVLARTAAAAAQLPDAVTLAWLNVCRAATAAGAPRATARQ
ncbi:MAG TPA: metallophosphoesterase [Vicinamibacterales bacterium]|nr:metallophosphoesterase [Vicinamibacterales bacterium]